MADEKNEIEKLIDNMIISGDELVANLKTVLPNSLAESMVMFHESNVINLKKINTINIILKNLYFLKQYQIKLILKYLLLKNW